MNCLTEISWGIEKLVNLEEFSIGNNNLKLLPAEILKLPKLKTFIANPNPWMTVDEIEEFNNKQSKEYEMCNLYRFPALEDLAHQALVNANGDDCQKCYCCAKKFPKPSISFIQVRNFLFNDNIPFLFSFCSLGCANQFNK